MTEFIANGRENSDPAYKIVSGTSNAALKIRFAIGPYYEREERLQYISTLSIGRLNSSVAWSKICITMIDQCSDAF
jgi:hypothetical protein